MKDHTAVRTDQTIESDLSLEIEQRYLAYALSTIVSRALPDVRDGLKPVHRRILYAMHAMGLHNTAKMRKSAAVVGEVIGKYHPHGDQAAYDALVRMAQDFSLRYPLIEGSGNFGSLDGDSPAAMRYTETRLSQFSNLLLQEIDEETTVFRPTYDAMGEEPVLLPAAAPNLLLNGSSGIAVGMSCSFPPHNLSEVMAACRALIKNPRLDVQALMSFIKGPDFPTAGEILDEPQSLAEMYQQGHGAVKVRGTYQVEHPSRNRTNIVVTSIPYTVNKARLIERIASLIRDRKLRQVIDVRDESTHEVRIVLELKSVDVNTESVMAFLYKHTELQINFPLQFIAITKDGIPERLGLHQILRQFLDFRYDVIVARLTHRLNVLQKRIHLLQGFEILFNDLDLALRLIRRAKNRQEAYEALRTNFPLDHEQIEAILELKLYKLVGMEVGKVLEELAAKRKEADEIARDLSSPQRIWQIMDREFTAIEKRFGDARRTAIVEPAKALAIDYRLEDLAEHEETTVILSRQGWIRRMKSRVEDASALKFREGDDLLAHARLDTTGTVAIFSNIGKVYVMRATAIPATTGFGEPLNNLASLTDGERAVGMLTCCPGDAAGQEDASAAGDSLDPARGFAEQQTLFDVQNDDARNSEAEAGKLGRGIVVTTLGRGFRFELDEVLTPTKRTGRKMVLLKPGDAVQSVAREDAPFLVIAADSGHVLRLPLDRAPVMTGPARGVQMMKLTKGAMVAAAVSARETDCLMVAEQDEAIHRVLASDIRLMNRAAVGKKRFPSVKSMEIAPVDAPAEGRAAE
ncbi:MAG: DNA gyrase/topoisomerase IV subunit A [Desulfomonilaceae bacterium]